MLENRKLLNSLIIVFAEKRGLPYLAAIFERSKDSSFQDQLSKATTSKLYFFKL
jgi:hypothetical protein